MIEQGWARAAAMLLHAEVCCSQYPSRPQLALLCCRNSGLVACWKQLNTASTSPKQAPFSSFQVPMSHLATGNPPAVMFAVKPVLQLPVQVALSADPSAGHEPHEVLLVRLEGGTPVQPV